MLWRAVLWAYWLIRYNRQMRGFALFAACVVGLTAWAWAAL